MKMLARAALVALLALAACLSPAVAQTDDFAGFSNTVSAPCRDWAAITPSDSVTFTRIPKAIYVGTGGDLRIVGYDAAAGSTGVVWKNVPTASMPAVRPRQVRATGTTATDLVACY